MPEPLVQVNNISKRFCRNFRLSLWYAVKDMVGEIIGRQKRSTLRSSEFFALDDISFELHRGSCLGIIGPNGAGKSTLLKIITGILKPEQGSVLIRGRVCALIQLMAGFNNLLTGRENVYVKAAILGMNKKEADLKMDEIVAFAELEEFIDSPVQTYSSGMMARLGFSIAIHTDPDVLIVDEVLAVGDAGFRNKCFKKILEVGKNSAIIFISHNIHAVNRVCDAVLIMDHGKVVNRFDKVGEGIECYLELFSKIEPRIECSKSLKVTDLLLNESALGKVCSVPFRSKLQLDFNLLGFISKAVEIRVYFQCLNLEVLSVISSLSDGVGLHLTPNQNEKISITIPELNLGVEKAYVTVEISDAETGTRLYYNYAMAILSITGHHETHFSPHVGSGVWEVKK